MGGSTLLVASICSAAFLVGLVPVLVEGLQVPLGRRLGMDDTRAGRLGKWFLLSFIPALLLSGLIIDRWGIQELLFFGLFLSALGLAGLGLVQNASSARWMVLGLGAACAFVTTACLMAMPHPLDSTKAIGQGKEVVAKAEDPNAQPKADDKPDPVKPKRKHKRTRVREITEIPPRSPQRMNLGFIFITLGALAAIPLVELLGRQVNVRQRILVLALVCLGPAAVVSLTPPKDFPVPNLEYDLASLFQDPRLWMAGLMALLYCPLEGSLTTWAQTFLKDLCHNPRSVTILMVGYWTVFLTARLATAWLIQPGYEMWLILILALLAAITFGNLSGAFNPTTGALAFLLVGLCSGPFLPTLLGVATTLAPHEQATVLGGLCAIGALGNLIFQPSLQSFAQSHTIRATLRIPMILALVLAIPTLVLALIRN